MLERDSSVSVHTGILQTLLTEIFKISNNTAPQILKDIFSLRPNTKYNLDRQSQFVIPQVKTVYNGTEIVSFIGPKIWDIVPSKVEEKEPLVDFKNAIKTWKPSNCLCRLFKNYIAGVGFI